ncbi:MAG TPA: 8-amino-7-oxononanoate synthase [Pirellulales bacterium]|jgi:8-amino-7-oxononanoate synthase|nr:8-amino-7-oxononanoate synthase [Pirellulales bacterium]
MMSHPADDQLNWIDAELAALGERNLLRRLRTHGGPQGATLWMDGREFVNFASNDYLGLAAEMQLTRAAKMALDFEGAGSGASPLIVGHGASLAKLDARLAEFEGTEAALVFPSGFAANLGTIAALVGGGDAVFSDELNHASIVDGCRLSRAAVHIYPHGDWRALESQLRGAAAFRRRLIVTDSLFSMDGDLAPLAELADLADRYGAMLMVDEAHATGLFGLHGRGICEQVGVEERVAVRVGTLSKALGAAGGFVCGRQSLIDWLVNRARTYIFSTALAPCLAAAACAAVDLVEREPQRRETLSRRAGRVRGRLAAQGWNIGPSASHIVPLVVGEAGRALDLSARLSERGLLVPAIRPPSVPAGASRLRISLCYGHNDTMIGMLLDALSEARS